jgi:hypothetical protein
MSLDSAPIGEESFIREMRPKEDIGYHREAGTNGYLLVENANPGSLGFVSRTRMVGLPIESNQAFMIRMNAAQNFHEGGLPGSIFSGKAINLSAVKRQRNSRERSDAAKALADLLKFQQRVGIHPVNDNPALPTSLPSPRLPP